MSSSNNNIPYTRTTTSSGHNGNTISTTTTTTTSYGVGRRNRGNTTPSHTHASITDRGSNPLLTVPGHNSNDALSRQTTREPFPPLPTPSASRVPSRNYQQDATSSGSRPAPAAVSTHNRRRPIGIKRLSSNDLREVSNITQASEKATARRRSASLPMRPRQSDRLPDDHNAPLQRSSTIESDLSPVMEREETYPPIAETLSQPVRSGSRQLRRVSDAAKSAVNRLSGSHDGTDSQQRHDEYDNDVVDLLDVLDPEVAALTTLTNVQNSLFVPDLGRWLNRRPTFQLSRSPTAASLMAQRESRQEPQIARKPAPSVPGDQLAREPTKLDIPSDIDEEPASRPRTGSVASIASHIKEERYAVLPHGVDLRGWSEEEIEMLDDHVRHMLHSRRSKFKRSMRAFGKYVSHPLGFLVTFYAVSITMFGLAWVLFLIGWIYVGERQLYIINVIDLVLVALFAVVGDGLAPFRAVDTYHMIYIAHYHRLSWRLRKQRDLPKLQDHNDLPEQHPNDMDVEASAPTDTEFSVLTLKQQEKLVHHQNKFAKSHSFYKAHETSTHYAFPLKLLIAIVVLLDAHSCFQIALGAVTWGTDYRTRPNAITPVILSCSITVNILAGILIKVGDKRTRKKDILEKMYRQQLTEEAMKKVEKKAEKEREANRKHDARLEQLGSDRSDRSDRSGRSGRSDQSDGSEQSDHGREGEKGEKEKTSEDF